MKLILRYIRPYFRRMGVGMFVKFTGTVMDLLLPWILAYVIDEVTPHKDQRALILWGVLMLICSVLAISFNILANRMASSVARDATETLRHDLFRRIVYLSNRQVDGFTVPSLISRMTTDTYNVHRMIGMMQRIGIRAPILVLGGVAVTMTLDPVLSGVLCAMLPLMAAVVYFLSKRSVPLFSSLQRGVDKLVRVVRENASGVRVVKSLSREQAERDRFRQANEDVMRRENKANFTMAALNPAMNFILNGGLVLVLLAGALRVNAGQTDVGKIIAFLSYFTIILNAMLSITRVITMYSVALASAGRIQEVMETERELSALEVPARDDGGAHLVFDRVTFSYHGQAPDLTEISFSLRQGESLGIIGPTGSGKSTVAQLLLRFYETGSGGIRLWGRDIRGFEPEELRRRFGVVFQNDVLFRDTIGENIRLGRSLSDREVERAARCAQAMDFIRAAGGFDAPVEAGGANLSGGQRQRLLLARALAGNPEVIVLDDSSSALDYRTDAALRQALREEYADTTTLIIAQRVSSIRHCTRILVLEDGREKGLGTHEQLLESCPEYRELCRIQMGEEAVG